MTVEMLGTAKTTYELFEDEAFVVRHEEGGAGLATRRVEVSAAGQRLDEAARIEFVR